MTDSEDHSTYRSVGRIKEGYHVRAGDHWLLVERVEPMPYDRVMLTVRGAPPVEVDAGGRIWSRSPAQQFYAVSAALPMRSRIRVARGTRLGNPFNGSEQTKIQELY